MAAIVGIFFILVYFGIIIVSIAGVWCTFSKAGQPGWAAIVPIYNVVVMIQIAGKPLWWIVLFLIPFVNIVIMILVLLALAERFGKSALFAIGMIFLPFIFWPILGLGDAKYLGPAAPPQGFAPVIPPR